MVFFLWCVIGVLDCDECVCVCMDVCVCMCVCVCVCMKSEGDLQNGGAENAGAGSNEAEFANT